MSPAVSNIYYLVIDLPGNVWLRTKNFFDNTLTTWWNSHY
jgi:hypothetical protein